MAPDSSQTPIAEVMAGEHVVHRTQEVLGRAREAPRAVSLATVYNLNKLVDMGEILEIAHADGR